MDEIDTLSNLIRVMDPEHRMGAGALAEDIVESEWMSAHDREVRAKAYEALAHGMYKENGGWAIATLLDDLTAMERMQVTLEEIDKKWGVER